MANRRHEPLPPPLFFFMGNGVITLDDGGGCLCVCRSRPVSKVNTAKRKPIQEAPVEVQGISERYDGMKGVVVVDSSNFTDVVMDVTKDIMVVFHAQACQACSHMAPYFRKMAERFHDLKVMSIVMARMDITNDFPPNELQLSIDKLPVIAFFPADAKGPPYR